MRPKGGAKENLDETLKIFSLLSEDHQMFPRNFFLVYCPALVRLNKSRQITRLCDSNKVNQLDRRRTGEYLSLLICPNCTKLEIRFLSCCHVLCFTFLTAASQLHNENFLLFLASNMTENMMPYKDSRFDSCISE